MFLKSWRALLVREYLEHRMAFVYFPLGILALFALSALSGILLNRLHFAHEFGFGSGLKLFELGYLILLAVWFAYFAVAGFFYFGDSFSADRRNNAMFFWKSMPISDVKILVSKFLAGITLFPLLILLIGAASGLLFFVVFNIAGYTLSGLIVPDPLAMLTSFAHITAFALVYVVFGVIWYAPFLAWVGALSTVFGRWSLPLAFVIPGLASVVENMVGFGQIPRGGYIWGYLSQRLSFGLSDNQLELLAVAPVSFDVRTYVWLLLRDVDWTQMAIGVVFTAAVIWLASEYRRRRIA